MGLESMEGLRADIKRNMQAAKKLPPDVAAYMNATVWPWAEALVDACDDELDELSETLAEVIEDSEELLHGETAAGLISALTLGSELAGELGKRLAPGDPLHAKITAFADAVTEQLKMIGEITVPDEPDKEGDAEDDDSDDEGQVADVG